jgi:FMN phosphatase YigB (HAD superfamily)
VSAAAPVVFLVDVDNTLLDNDAVLDDLRLHVQQQFGARCWDRYWGILMELWDELGYRDYIGALQRYRIEHPHEPQLLALSFFLVDYPFADRLFPGALDVLARLRSWGPTVLLSDGDVVFQPRKVQRSGLWSAVDGHVLIYVHKERELNDVVERYPAERYVLIDDKLNILTPTKRAWGARLTTVFPRQGQYAHDPKIVAANPIPDVTVERIGDLLSYDLPTLLAAARQGAALAASESSTADGAARPAAAPPSEPQRSESP